MSLCHSHSLARARAHVPDTVRVSMRVCVCVSKAAKHVPSTTWIEDHLKAMTKRVTVASRDCSVNSVKLNVDSDAILSPVALTALNWLREPYVQRK